MRLRLILSFAVIVLVTITSMVLIARQNTATEVRAFMYRGGITSSTDVVDSLSAYYESTGSWDGVEALLSPYLSATARRAGGSGNPGGNSGMSNMMDFRLRLADCDGLVLVDSDSTDPSFLSITELEAAQPIKVNLKTVGYLLLDGMTGYSRNEEINLVNRLNQAAITAGLIAGGVSLLLGLLLAYRLLKPVQALTEAAGKLGKGDLSQRVVVKGSDEMATLANTFNHMADSLQKAQQSRRDMTADIAHELRTPLAVQRANLEALQDGIYPTTAENLASILEQNLFLTRLVNDLRTLALAETGELPLEKTETMFQPLVERIIDRFRPQANQQQVDLLFTKSQLIEQPVLLDPMRFEQILTNLLSNALRHTPTGGKIRVQVEQRAAKINLTVHDSGPGIPQESLPHIFERFYRADRSRSRSEGGTGLGLSIALHLAQLHGGNLTAANHPQGGALFTLDLPYHRTGSRSAHK